MLAEVERGRSVQVAVRTEMRQTLKRRWGPYVPIEAEEIRHGTDREIRHEVHSAGVDLVDRILPVGEGAPVGVEDGEVEWGIT